MDERFLSQQYSKCYDGDINLIPDSMRHDLSSLGKHKILPPKLNRKPGRPKKKRKPSFGEGKKKGKKHIFCSQCSTWGKRDGLTCGVPVK